MAGRSNGIQKNACNRSFVMLAKSFPKRIRCRRPPICHLHIDPRLDRGFKLILLTWPAPWALAEAVGGLFSYYSQEERDLFVCCSSSCSVVASGIEFVNLPPGFLSKSSNNFPWRSRAPGSGWVLLTAMVVLLCSYFLYMPAQHEVESRFASQLARRLQWYPLEFQNTPITNLAQVLYDVHGGYPYGWHEWFRDYGSDAGFAHSLAEKYVLAPVGSVSSR